LEGPGVNEGMRVKWASLREGISTKFSQSFVDHTCIKACLADLGVFEKMIVKWAILVIVNHTKKSANILEIIHI
jgi:hypothetical protein